MFGFGNNNGNDGNDDQQRQMYQRFAQAYDNGRYDDVDDREVVQGYERFARQAPPEMQQQVYSDYFQQMPQDQRQQFVQQFPQQYQGMLNPNDPRAMAQGFQRMSQEQYSPSPQNPLESLFGQGGALSSPIAKAALVGIAGMVGKRMLGGR